MAERKWLKKTKQDFGISLMIEIPAKRSDLSPFSGATC